MLFCADCKVNSCNMKYQEPAPNACPGRDVVTEDLLARYQSEENLEFGRVCSEVSMSKDGPKPRILEIIEVAQKMNYEKLGLAFCIGFVKEAVIAKKVFEHHGFEVCSIVCKVGGVDKSVQGIENGGNAMYNSLGQAQLLNEEKTDLNIVIGLCVGHDSMFFRASDAPVTVLGVKDKVLAHNPLACLYVVDDYYHDILFPPKE